MFYVASKLFFALARPIHFLLLVSIVGYLALLFGRRRAALWLLGLAVVGFNGIAFTPAAQFAIKPLEDRFPRPDVIDPAPDGIIVLGGAMELALQFHHGNAIPLNDAAERLTEIPALARLYPKARIIYTGGPEDLGPGVLPEAKSAKLLLSQMGVDPDRIVIEDKSLTTWENAVYSKALVNPAPGTRWLLVTSAFHMPRSMGIFRKIGWPGLIAFPTDYRTLGGDAGYTYRLLAVDNYENFEVAVKEYFGLLGYWLTGRTGELFPAP